MKLNLIMNVIIKLGLFYVTLNLACAQTNDCENLIQYVDPLIGTGTSTTISNTKHGAEHVHHANAQVIPAVTMPFGMTNWTPQTSETEDKCNAPYYYEDTLLQGLRGSHWLSGSCTQDYGSVTVMPITGPLKCSDVERASRFDHNKEISTPAYYSVDLLDYNIQTEMTATTRSAIMRFTFNEADSAYIIVTPNSDEGEGFIEIDPEHNEIFGYNPVHRIYQGWGKYAGFKGYFVIKFRKKFEDYGVYHNSAVIPHLKIIQDKNNLGAYVGFSPTAGEKIYAKVGTSFTSIENARKNLDTEIPDWNFQRVRSELEKEWNTLLGRFRIQAASQEEYVKFYTAIYHCFQQPRIVNNVDGSYVGFADDDNIHHADGFNYYDDFSMWDTYRALHPLYTLMMPQQTSDMIKSFILKAEQGGWLPIFPLFGNYTSAMIGDHVISCIGDALVKGIDDFDLEKAYFYMRQNAFELPKNKEDYIDGKGRRALDSYLKYNYIPLEDNVEFAFHGNEQASRTLEYAYDDFVLAQVARKLGKAEDYEILKKRAYNYKNVFDPQSGYVRGRHQDGAWCKDFVPTQPMKYVTEATPWHYSWYVPHDIKGLIDIMGGQASFIARLDSFFLNNHYWHGNEPGHQVPYLYNYAGQPAKTQQIIRQILKEEYGVGRGGLSGNDDSGQLSAWYIFSVMGFYPVCPGTPYYVIGTPSFNEIELSLSDGKKFKILALNNSSENCYIKSVKLNGEPYHKTYISHFDIINGGTLEFEMTSDDSTGWGCSPDSVPFSLSENEE